MVITPEPGIPAAPIASAIDIKLWRKILTKFLSHVEAGGAKCLSIPVLDCHVTLFPTGRTVA